jgi:cytoskeletal protein RodZ
MSTSLGVTRVSSATDGSAGAGTATGVLEQPASAPKMKKTQTRKRVMWLLLLEAVGAMALLILIVWWTMFSGRRRGERESPPDEVESADQADLPR